MAANDLYLIEDLQFDEKDITATLVLNPAHPIFEGHFPEQPVLPGACMLDMAKVVVSKVLPQVGILLQTHNIKFITPVDPVKTGTLQIKITYQKTTGGIKFKTVISGDAPCMKMDGLLQTV